MNEEIFSSTTLDMEASSLSELKFRRTFSIVTSSKVITHLRQGYAAIEFFAVAKPTYLERLERWDEMRELRGHDKPVAPDAHADTRPAVLPQMRRSETDFVVEQSHDIVAWVQIKELGADGQYIPVPVFSQSSLDPGVFSLHQGLQRRIALVLSSDSGLQLPWTDLTRVRLGNVRLLDPKGRQHDSTSKALVTLPLLADQTVAFGPDGTGTLTAEALWDSSVHDSFLLNRVTANAHRVILQIAWSVAVDTCSEPVQFSMDIAVAIQTRDARPPSRFLTFLSSGKITSRISAIFNLRLSPPLTRSPQDLWRLDTSEKYVRGEELLNHWKPRGISVVEDYNRLVLTERRAADVQAVRVLLTSSFLPVRPDPGTAVWGSEALLRKALGLWKRRFGHAGEVSLFELVRHTFDLDYSQIILSQVPTESDGAVAKSAKPSTRELPEGVKLNSCATLIPRR